MALSTLIFASNNQHKADEIRVVLDGLFQIRTLKEAGIFLNIPEPHNTLEENAAEKSGVIYKLTNGNCFSEDSGLEVAALNGEPGVKSARYAEGDDRYTNNTQKLLANLSNVADRRARFRTVISLILHGKEYQFEGICNGRITETEKGTNGFGYDPVFVPDEADKTFGEMTLEEKTIFSHRNKATQKFIEFLKANNGQDQN